MMRCAHPNSDDALVQKCLHGRPTVSIAERRVDDNRRKVRELMWWRCGEELQMIELEEELWQWHQRQPLHQAACPSPTEVDLD